jgi:predicted PilT family ATPase
MTVTAQLEKGAKPIAFSIDSQSSVEIDDKPATIKQIRTGLWVRSIRLSYGTPPVVEDLDLTSAIK